MKKNLVLLGVFLTFLLGAYLFEERGKAQLFEKNESKLKLFNLEGLGELKGFKNVSFSLLHRDGHYFGEESNRLIDAKKLDEIFKVLAAIRIKRVLEPSEYQALDEELFFLNEDQKLVFHFEKGEVEFILGNKIEYDQTFYMKVKEQLNEGVQKTSWVIADDSSVLDEFYQKETAHRSPKRYQRLQRIISSREELLRDMHIFPMHFISGKYGVFKTAEITFKGRPSFTINFSTNTTIPTPKETRNYKLDQFGYFSEQLKNLEASEERVGQLNEEQRLASYIVKDLEDNVFNLTLYNDVDKYFITTSLYPNIIFSFKERPTALLVHWEDFWSK